MQLWFKAGLPVLTLKATYRHTKLWIGFEFFPNPWMHLKYLRKAVTEMIKTRSVPTLPPLWVMKMQKSIIEQTKSLSCLTYEYGFKERRNSFRVYYLCLYTYMISSCASKSHLNKNMSVQLLQMLRYEKMDMYVKAT